MSKKLTIEEFIKEEYDFDPYITKTFKIICNNEYWFQQFLTYFYNFSFQYGHRFDNKMKLHTFRAYKIKCLKISKQQFVESYKTEPIAAIQELFQEFIHPSQFKFLKKYKNEPIELLYDIVQVLPDQKFIKSCLGRSLQYAYETALSLSELEKYERYQSYLRATLEGHTVTKEKNEFVIIQKKKEPLTTSISNQNQKTKQVSQTKWVRNSRLAVSLKELYKHTCQCCKTSYPSRTGYLSEAHHVQGYNDTHKGDDSWENMIVLCPTCHGWFDDSYFAIHPETFVLHCYDESHPLHGTVFQTQPNHQLHPSYLEYAWHLFIQYNENKKICH